MKYSVIKGYVIILTTLTAFLLLLSLIIGHSVPLDLDERAEEALEYCKENGYSTEYCLLVDYILAWYDFSCGTLKKGNLP